MHELHNISPVDGRYAGITRPLQPFFSEYALIRYRVIVEIEYFIALCQLPLPPLKDISARDVEALREIANGFSEEDAAEIKKIEKNTNHDIKAVEYFVKDRLVKASLGRYKEFVHFGLTSQDINNTALPLSLKEAMEAVVWPAFTVLHDHLARLSDELLHTPMLAHTHGQPASPTTMGKELRVFYERFKKQFRELKKLPYPAKFGGATGNFNAHHVAYPDIDWVEFADKFTASLGLSRSKITTQIDHYDDLAALFDTLKRICTILIDLDRDLWTYISMDYFKQKVSSGETGSSTMPHKVNPIDFENSEGNAGMAAALFEHLSAKLPVSRLQRDLTDSTVIRNTGLAVAHLLISVKACTRGLNKISINKEKINQDLENNPAVVAEAIQTILRTLNYPEPYEALKTLTRKNSIITKQDMEAFIDALNIAEEDKNRLKQINPFNYTGIIPKKIQ